MKKSLLAICSVILISLLGCHKESHPEFSLIIDKNEVEVGEDLTIDAVVSATSPIDEVVLSFLHIPHSGENSYEQVGEEIWTNVNDSELSVSFTYTVPDKQLVSGLEFMPGDTLEIHLDALLRKDAGYSHGGRDHVIIK